MRTAVVGCGLVARKKYFPAFRRLGRRAELRAVCDLDARLLQLAGAQLGNGVRLYTQLGELLRQEEPELVVLCTPPGTHGALAVEAIEAGAHVLLEKPMALTVQECDRIMDAADQGGRRVGVMHNQYYNAAFSEALEAAERGVVGRFLGMHVLLATPTDYMTSDPDHWAHRLPGGVLGETGPHAVYLSLPWIGRVEKAHVLTTKLMPECPWSVGEDIRFHLVGEAGVSTVSLMYGSRCTSADIQIHGQTGTIRTDLQARTTAVVRRDSLRASTVAWSVISEARQHIAGLAVSSVRYLTRSGFDAHQRGIERFLECLSSGAEYPSSGREGREVVRVIELLVRDMERETPGPSSGR